MKILIIGNGGREHTIAWKLRQSTKVSKIYVASGNGGTAVEDKCINIDINVDSIHELVDFAFNNQIDLTVVGPEVPLSIGIVDLFEERGLKIFGPNKAAAKIEASKAFAKEIMIASGVPTGSYERFVKADKAIEYIKAKGVPIVVKADGLAAGKGVTVAYTIDDAINAVNDILVGKIFSNASQAIIVEEFLKGEEVSYLAVTDGINICPLASSQDHKAVLDGDKGANTGGMGAYSPAPVLSEDQYSMLSKLVIAPIIEELAKRGIKFKGVLYAGLMVDHDINDDNLSGVKVLEYNARFGDPETQALLPRIDSGLLELLLGVANGDISDVELKWSDKYAVSVVLASGGYPAEFETGYTISGIDDANALKDVKVFHAGTKEMDGEIVNSGGRVLNVTALADTLKDAIDKSYEAVNKIRFKDMHYRKDIGAKALNR